MPIVIHEVAPPEFGEIGHAIEEANVEELVFHVGFGFHDGTLHWGAIERKRGQERGFWVGTQVYAFGG